MSNALLVFLGGGIGSLLRWAIDRIRPAEYLPNPLDLYLDELPGATIIVNVLGCFIFGFIITLPPATATRALGFLSVTSTILTRP